MNNAPKNKAYTVTSNKALLFVAKGLSYLFHPVFMPLYITLLLHYLVPQDFNGFTPLQYKQWLANIGLTMVFFPLFTVLLLKGLGFLKSFQMEQPKDRIIPLMATMIFYFWSCHVFNNIPSPLILKSFIMGSFWGIIVLFMINIFVKISLHTAAAGAMLGILLVLLFHYPSALALPLVVATLVALLLGWARLICGAHTRAELVLGYLSGILVQLGAYAYMR
jgi:hypothetical protein